MNGHNIKMWIGFLIIFFGGVASAYSGGFTVANVVAMVVAGLMAIEHGMNGATSS